MINKLGILSKGRFEQIENTLIETKISLLDYEFTLGESEYNFDFLIKLHDYLFGDIYILQNHGLRNFIDDEVKNRINALLNRLTIKGVYGVFDEESLDIFYKLWQIQIFTDGNARTLIGFLKIYASAFQLEKYIDFKEFYFLWNQGFSFKRVRIKK